MARYDAWVPYDTFRDALEPIAVMAIALSGFTQRSTDEIAISVKRKVWNMSLRQMKDLGRVGLCDHISDALEDGNTIAPLMVWKDIAKKFTIAYTSILPANETPENRGF